MQQEKVQENTGEGVASKEAESTVQVTVTGCNYHVTPFRKDLYGSLDYYYDEKKNVEGSGFLSRHFDFLDRHQGCHHQVPEYYEHYGYKYVNILSHQLNAIVSDKGKKWIKKARCLLQDYMEDGFEQNINESTFSVELELNPKVYYKVKNVGKERLELDNETFKTFAFDTHPLAYIEAGLHDISLGDKIFLMALLGDALSDRQTQIQMVTIAKDGAQRYQMKYANDITAAIISAAAIAPLSLQTIYKINLDRKKSEIIGETVNIDDTKTIQDGKVLFEIYTAEELQQLYRLRVIIDNMTYIVDKGSNTVPIALLIKMVLYAGMEVMNQLDIDSEDVVSAIEAGVKGIQFVITGAKLTMITPVGFTFAQVRAGIKAAKHTQNGMKNLVDHVKYGDGSGVGNFFEFYGDAIKDIWNDTFE